MDTWLLVRMLESNGERDRLLYVLKSGGMAHSNQMREFVLSEKGINLVDVYVDPGTVLTGSARLQQEASALRAQLEVIAARLATIESELRISKQLRAAGERTETAARPG